MIRFARCCNVARGTRSPTYRREPNPNYDLLDRESALPEGVSAQNFRRISYATQPPPRATSESSQ
jgi:hypothetical protein